MQAGFRFRATGLSVNVPKPIAETRSLRPKAHRPESHAGWRDWQTHRTQNLAFLRDMGPFSSEIRVIGTPVPAIVPEIVPVTGRTRNV